MTTAPFATTADVAAAWRPLSAAETTTAESLLRYASAIIRTRVTDIDSRITAGTLDADLAEMVAVAMVKRVLLNPEGWSQEGIEDFSRTRSRAVSDGALYISASEIKLLSKRGGGAFTVPVACGSAALDTERGHVTLGGATSRRWRP